jgi:transcriptional antiterminator RfaH
MCWCVVQVRVGRELLAADLLQKNLHLVVYLPEVMQRWHGKMQLGPLFPGYLFAHEDYDHSSPAHDSLAQVDSTPGCGHLVRFGSPTARAAERIAVADDVVELLRAKVRQLNQGGGLPAHHLHPGDSVQITAGPMEGLNAIFLGPLTPTARIQVLLHFLGREQAVTVPLDSVVSCTPALKRVRRTRGQHRYIHTAS